MATKECFGLRYEKFTLHTSEGDPLVINKWRIPLFSKPRVVERKLRVPCLNCGNLFTLPTKYSSKLYCSPICGHIKGLKRSLSTREKMSLASKGIPKSEEHKDSLSKAHLGKKLSPEHRKHISQSGKEAWQRYEVKEKHLKQEFKRSSLEMMFEEEMECQGVQFFKQQVLMNRYKVDFLLYGDIVVECDGEYWHGREWVKEKDIKRDEELSANGWIVRRFKETDIRNDVKSCVDSLIQEFPFIKVYSGKEEMKQDRQQKLYKMKYEQKMTNRAIAKEFHVRRSTIRMWLKEIENNDSAWICTKGCLPHSRQLSLSSFRCPG